jgi:UDP-N-acetylglucosamine:LPS N-acetylglucosamine transferase
MKKDAVVVIDENEMMAKPEVLEESIKSVLSDKVNAHKMAKTFNSFSRPDAAKDVAKMIISSAK